MATAVTLNLNASLVSSITRTLFTGVVSQLPLVFQNLLAFVITNGTGVGKANKVYVDQRTLASTATEDIDMFDFGDVRDAVGNLFAMSNIKMLIIQNLGLNDGSVPVEGDSLSVGGKNTSAAWLGFFADKTDIVKVLGGDTLIIAGGGAAGYSVTDATNNLLTILNNSGSRSVTYNIIAVGESA